MSWRSSFAFSMVSARRACTCDWERRVNPLSVMPISKSFLWILPNTNPTARESTSFVLLP